ncbi:hypothetical protein PO78_4379 [Thauera sp. SWB20]|nr:hypothetical protein PO78_4379 [Thauera sp. SWB20]
MASVLPEAIAQCRPILCINSPLWCMIFVKPAPTMTFDAFMHRSCA